jgi:hypothetical protein
VPLCSRKRLLASPPCAQMQASHVLCRCGGLLKLRGSFCCKTSFGIFFCMGRSCYYMTAALLSPCASREPHDLFLFQSPRGTTIPPQWAGSRERCPFDESFQQSRATTWLFCWLTSLNASCSVWLHVASRRATPSWVLFSIADGSFPQRSRRSVCTTLPMGPACRRGWLPPPSPPGLSSRLRSG